MFDIDERARILTVCPGGNFSFILGPVMDGGGGLNHLASDVQGPRCQEF